MLRSGKQLRECRLRAMDADLGRVKDFLFDDERWTVRYLVAETGNWLAGRQLLVSPQSVQETQPHQGLLQVNLSRKQIQETPAPISNRPSSSLLEPRDNWPVYWGGPWDWGTTPFPGVLTGAAASVGTTPPGGTAEPHLRSLNEVAHYSIQALNDLFGHCADFILDDEGWMIRYWVVDTRSWWPGKKVLMSPDWIAWVSWAEARVYIDLDRDTVQHAPEYDPSVPLTRDYEERLFGHYARTPYWGHLSEAA